MMTIAPGIHSLSQREGGRVHAFLLETGDTLTLIDTLYDDDGQLVLAAIATLGRRPQALTRIVLTHAHKSHVGGVAALKRATNATIYAHPWEVDIVAGRRKATRVSKQLRRPFQVMHLQLGLAFGVGSHQPCEVDRSLVASHNVGPLEVIPTPGHTPGCVSFWWPERRALFAGDVIATWPELAAGWPGLTLDNAQNLRSVQELTAFGNAEILGIGHGEPIVTDAAARIRELVS